MKKHLLFGFALAVSVSAFSQTAKQVKPNGVTDRLSKKGLTAEPNEFNNSAKNTTGIVRTNKPVSAAKTSSTAAATCTKFSGSANAFGIYQDGHEALQYNADLNALSFVHRCSSTYTSIPNGNTGVVVAKYSTNQGVNWDSTVIWTNTTNLARYPQGGLYNPPGNTVFTNAYVVGMGETTSGSGFNGNWLASKKITVPGNTTPGTDMQFFANTAPFGGFKKFDFARYAFTYTKDGFVRGLGQICNDINNTSSNVGRGNRGAAIIKGTFNAGSFVWSYDSLVPATMTRPDGSKYLNVYNNMMAWNDAGTVGYVVMTGVRAGASGTTKGFQPIVYKTTNSGASWSLMPAQSFAGPLFQGVDDRCLTVNTSSTLVVPYFNTGEGMDAAVDINDNLHIATTIVGTSSAHNDSLDYTYQFTSNSYQFPYGPFGNPTIFDFYTTTSGGWNYHIVDSMGTEGPSGTSGQPGYTSNPWGPSGVFIDARIQMAVSPDRKKMFYSWTESDSSIVGLKWNIYPDIKVKGFDVTLNKVTQRLNITSGVTSPDNADQQAYLHLMANRSITTNTTTSLNEIPFTISYNGTNDGNVAITHFYLKGASFQQSDFVLNPLSPTGIKTIANNNSVTELGNYPNPASGFTTISLTLTEAKDFDVTLYNTIGQALKTIKVKGQIGNNNVNLDLNNLNAGVYMYSISTEGSSITRKLVVQ